MKLFDPEDKRSLLLFKMELTFDDEKMEFYPSFQDLEDTILFIVTRIGQTLQVLFNCIYLLNLQVQCYTVCEHINNLGSDPSLASLLMGRTVVA